MNIFRRLLKRFRRPELPADDQAPERVNWFWTPRSDLWFPEDELEIGRCYERKAIDGALLLLYDYLDRERDICYFTILAIDARPVVSH